MYEREFHDSADNCFADGPLNLWFMMHYFVIMWSKLPSFVRKQVMLKFPQILEILEASFTNMG